MALLDRVREVNRRLPQRHYYRLQVNGILLGFIDTQLLDELSTTPLFSIDNKHRRVSADVKDRQEFETELAAFFKSYFARHRLSGWRDELYGVSENFADEAVFVIERAALSYLGLTGYGVHINGYVEQPDGSIHMWIAKRSLNKPTSPGKLDQIAAGGQPHGISLSANVVKECQEEASIPPSLSQQAKPVSAISYWHDLDIGVRPDVVFNYDLRLPADFVPQVNDDEVDSFVCYPMDELLQRLADTQDFKFNSAVVVIDFAIRHGLIAPDHPDYVALQAGMNRPLRTESS